MPPRIHSSLPMGQQRARRDRAEQLRVNNGRGQLDQNSGRTLLTLTPCTLDSQDRDCKFPSFSHPQDSPQALWTGMQAVKMWASTPCILAAFEGSFGNTSHSCWNSLGSHVHNLMCQILLKSFLQKSAGKSFCPITIPILGGNHFQLQLYFSSLLYGNSCF